MPADDEIINAERAAQLILLRALEEVVREKDGAWISHALNLAQAYAFVVSKTPGGAVAES